MLTSTRDYIISELQRYKLYWQQLLGKKVHLEFKDGHIEVITALPGSEQMVLIDRYAIKNFNFDSLNLRKKKRAWKKIQRIESWLAKLSTEQREALFWKFVNHDFEEALIIDEINEGIRWKTLSYQEIAKKMGRSKSTIWEYVHRALDILDEIIA